MFKDSASGGGDFMKRPAIVEMLAYIDKHPHQQFIMVFDDLSRLARDVIAHFKLRTALKEREVEIYCLNYNFDESEEGELIEYILAAQNQYHRKQNRRQVIQKERARLELGYWTFNSVVPGYQRNDRSARDWILIKKEPKASIIKDALEGFASGRFQTKTEVQKFLQSKDYLHDWKNKAVYLSMVDRLFERAPLYAGFIEYPRWDIERRMGKHEAIISPAILVRIEERLKDKRRVRIREDYSGDFPLRPYTRCGYCQKPLTASWTTGRTKRYPYYRCTGKNCDKANKSIPKDKIESDFRSLLESLEAKNELVSLCKAVLDDLYKKKHKENQGTLSWVQNEIKKLESEIDDFMERAIKTSAPAMVERYELKAPQLIEEKKLLESKVESNEEFDIKFGTAVNEVLDILKNPVNKWDSEDLEEKKLVIKLVFDGDPTYKQNCGFGTAELSCVIRLFERISATNSLDVEMGGVEPPSALVGDYASTVCSHTLRFKS